tara:strand:+ start:541 stop:993 length:453 start_codon:yes stop_codon:yes gene_type:complete
MKKILITERQLERLTKKVLNEQTVPDSDKKLNIFCQSDILNDSFHESGLTYSDDKDLHGGVNNGGFKRISLQANPNIPRQTYEIGYNQPITLDAILTKNLSKDLLKRTKISGHQEGQDILAFIIHKKRSPYFCKIERGTDSAWATYLNNL